MKKHKGERITASKANSKPTNHTKNGPSKKNLLQKKQVDSHKENHSLLHEVSSLLKPTKKSNVRSKERSKSLIYDKKAMQDAHSSQANRVALFDLLQKKIDKADTDISGHLHSVKNDRFIFGADRAYSNFLSPHSIEDSLSDARNNREATPRLKLLREENETLRTNLSAVKEQMNACLKKREAVQLQNQALRCRVSAFQCENEGQLSQLRQNEQRILDQHSKERKKLHQQVVRLQQQQEKLLKEKGVLEGLLASQEQNIRTLQSQKQELQAACLAQREEKAIILREKEVALQRIRGLEEQLLVFEGNLKEFEQMRETYQQKLTQLQKEKQKIKRNAFELLELVQNYRNM